MAMILINKKEIEENGAVFIVETYQSDNTGRESVVRYTKPSDVAEEPVVPEPTQLDRIEAQMNELDQKIQTNEELQTFYDDIMKEVGL